jgi:hypothetical protein
MFGNGMIDYVVLGLMVLFALGGVATWYTSFQKARGA